MTSPDRHAVRKAVVPTPLAGPFELHVPTYDGSGQTVEPDIVFFPGGWNGWEYWMAINPYPRGDASVEHPSIVVSHDGLDWVVPPGAVNPVVPRDGANSDPDLSYDPVGDRLVLHYRQVREGANVILSTSSRQGSLWSVPRVAFRETNHGAVGPSTVHQAGGRTAMWYLDAGPQGCRSGATTLKLRTSPSAIDLAVSPAAALWSAPVTTDLRQPGQVLWETDVEYVASTREYWAIYPAFPDAAGSCGRDDLFFARSGDGLTWSVHAVPFLRRGFSAWADGTLYKATFVYDADHDLLRVWFSAMARDGTWHLGFVSYRFSAFEQALAGA
ncbi:MAG: hypothetical protein HY084_11635 [Gemmatimonadetes bacterium]|nr:hypothetical protein [Gemmatimonadota bacterium]